MLDRSKTLPLVFGAAMVGFLLLPLVAILPLAFTQSDFMNYPIRAVSGKWFTELFTAEMWTRALKNTLIIGGGTTVLATTLGTLAAIGLRQRIRFLTTPLNTVLLLPMVVPAVITGVGLQILYARIGLSSSYLGVICAHTVLALPLVVIAVSNALNGLDPRLELAAASLGATPLARLRHVVLPLALPGVITGALMAFSVSLDEVVLTLFVGGPAQRTLAGQMFNSLRETVNPTIAAAAFVIIVLTLAFGLLLALIRRSER